jgi:hypothetical protein
VQLRYLLGQEEGSMHKRILLLALAASFAMLSCTVVIPTIPRRHSAPPPEAPRRHPRRIGPFRNNSTVRLEPGVYRGNVEIRANKVVLLGSGVRRTVIEGTVAVYGNGCVIRDLTVAGNLILAGNKNNAAGTLVRGRVVSRGNNNRW